MHADRDAEDKQHKKNNRDHSTPGWRKIAHPLDSSQDCQPHTIRHHFGQPPAGIVLAGAFMDRG
jgi:hypothetical protein